MGMSDAVWQRHTNPLSGWSRMSILPLFALAIWSRVWLGWWCLIPIGLVLFWTWWNPRAFAIPENTDNWMSKGVLGERIWLDRKSQRIATHHTRAIGIISVLPIFGLVPFAYGLIYFDLPAMIFGLVLTIVFKLWFLDRMVWLYEDVSSAKNVERVNK